MKQRIISAIVMIAIGLPALIIGGVLLNALLTVVSIFAFVEISSIKDGKFNLKLFAIDTATMILFFNVFNQNYFLFGLLIIALFVLSIFDEYFNETDIATNFILTALVILGVFVASVSGYIHKFLLLYIAIASLVCDAGAYFVGVFFGKRKLIERISPNKTIEGAIGGFIISAVISFVFALFNDFFGVGALAIGISSLVMPIISQIGDLAFSYIKRAFKIKDFGKLIPGHGGVLDRFDSVLFCLTFFGFILMAVLS